MLLLPLGHCRAGCAWCLSRQPCPHTALKGQGPTPLPDPWEFDYTSGPKHGIFIVVSDITQNPKMHLSGAQLTWLWPTAITSLHHGISDFSATQRPRCVTPRHLEHQCSQGSTLPAARHTLSRPSLREAPSKGWVCRALVQAQGGQLW